MRWREALAPALALFLLVAGLAACGGPNGGRGAAEAKEKAGRDGEGDGSDEAGSDQEIPVEVARLDRGRIESVLRFSTNLEAESEVQVFSQAARQVRQLLVEEGDEVRRGQVLLRLQDEQQRTALVRVQSQLEKAKREYGRQENLYRQNLISEQVFTEATYELEQLELSLADARRELSYTEVEAPISGTITARHVNLGDQVTVNQLLFDIVDFDSIVARVYVPEKELSRIRVSQEARVRAEATRGDPRNGRVVRIAPRVDPRSGTVKVTVGIPRNQELLPGMYVSVSLVTEVHEDAVLVPKRALVHDADRRYVFRLVDGAVERLQVEASLEDERFIEPGGGLAAGDQVVVAGQAGLKDGSKVRIVDPSAPPPAAEPQAAAGEAVAD